MWLNASKFTYPCCKVPNTMQQANDISTLISTKREKICFLFRIWFSFRLIFIHELSIDQFYWQIIMNQGRFIKMLFNRDYFHKNSFFFSFQMFVSFPNINLLSSSIKCSMLTLFISLDCRFLLSIRIGITCVHAIPSTNSYTHITLLTDMMEKQSPTYVSIFFIFYFWIKWESHFAIQILSSYNFLQTMQYHCQIARIKYLYSVKIRVCLGEF